MKEGGDVKYRGVISDEGKYGARSVVFKINYYFPKED
jgi:hypothetical protein